MGTAARGAWGAGEHGAWGAGDHGAHGSTAAREATAADTIAGGAWGAGDHGAWGGGRYGAHGSTPALPVPEQFADVGLSVVLERATGQTRSMATADRAGLSAVDVTREANAVSDFEVDVPYAPSLERWGFATLHLGFDGGRIFRGVVVGVDSDPDGPVTTLSGPGPLGRLRWGDVSITFDGETFVDKAVEVFLDRHLVDGLRYSVTTPQPEHRQSFDAREFEGSPLKVLAEICELGGLAFSVDHREREPTIRVFRPGIRSQRPQAWRTDDVSRSLDLTEYANKVVVRGAAKGDGSGEHYRASVRDDTEIREITDGTPKTRRIVQPDYTSDAQCRARAAAELEDALGQRTLSASATTSPTLASTPPGVYYRVAELDDAGIVDGAAYLPLTSLRYSESRGDAKVDLEFADSDAVRDALRAAARAREDDSDPSLQRLDGS